MSSVVRYRTGKSSLIRNRLFYVSRGAVLRNLLKIGVVAGLISVGVLGCSPQPSDQVPTIDGNSVRLAGDKWLVVNYWAEWCGPCRHEIPELNELDGPTGSEALQVAVLGVNYDGLRDQKLAEVSERMGIEFAVLADDPRERWGQPNPTVLPSTYLIAPGGEFVETLVGPQTRAGILSRIQSLASARQAAADG